MIAWFEVKINSSMPFQPLDLLMGPKNQTHSNTLSQNIHGKVKNKLSKSGLMNPTRFHAQKGCLKLGKHIIFL